LIGGGVNLVMARPGYFRLATIRPESSDGLPNGKIRVATPAQRSFTLRGLFNAGRLRPDSRSRLGPHELRLFGGEKQSPHHEMPDLTRFPLPLHDSPGGVAVRAKQQMTDFVGYEAMTQPRIMGSSNSASSFLARTYCVLVVNAGENRMDCKTEDIVLELILNGHSKHPQPDVGSLGRFLARFPAG